MQIEWNRVTWYSKLLAVIVFVATFGIAFCLGVHWQQAQIENSLIQTPADQTIDDNGIGEGPAGGATIVGVGEHCGGFIQNAPRCATGSHCQLKASMPDTGGTCVKD